MVDLCMAYMLMLMLMLMTLTFMQGHSGLAKAKNQRWIILTTKQAISVKLATMVDHFYVTLTENVYMAWPSCLRFVGLSCAQEKAPKKKKKFRPYRGKLKSAGLSKMTESLDDTEMQMYMTEMVASMPPHEVSSNLLTMPASCHSILKVSIDLFVTCLCRADCVSVSQSFCSALGFFLI